MSNGFKPFGKLLFFTFLMAVAVRPVVVNAASVGSQSEAFSTPIWASANSPSGLEKASAALTKPFWAASQFKIIPRESVSVNVLTPQFSRICISTDLGRSVETRLLFVRFFRPQPLVLRI